MDAYSDNDKIRLQLQEFVRRLNQDPDPKELDKTPDGKANSLPISFVEMTLDELFLGMWGTQNFTSKVIANEVVGELELVCIHPITGVEIRRVGSAAIQIMVDKAPQNIEGQERNRWALNPDNKKPNALDLSYPKLKAECVKNAAQSLGKLLGRDINRKKQDKFKEAYKSLTDEGFKALVDRVKKGESKLIAIAESTFVLNDLQKDILSKLKPQALLNGSV